MKRRLALALFCLIGSALPAQAGNIGINFDIRLKGSLNAWWGCNGCGIAPGGCNGCGPGGLDPYTTAPLAPWYLYYPLEAQFQTPAPMTYPFWPSPMTPPQPAAPATLQRTGYYPSAPAYWYGR